MTEEPQTAPEAQTSAETQSAPEPEAQPGPEAQPVPEAPWHRLNPRTALVGITNLAVRGVPLAFAAVALSTAGDGFPTALIAIVVGLLLNPVTYLIRYLTFRYRVAGRELQVASGLLWRTSHSVPLERIRTVDVESRLLHRLFRVAVVNIATGEAKADQRIKLDAVDRERADDLRRTLLRLPNTGSVDDAVSGVAAGSDHAAATAAEATQPDDATLHDASLDVAQERLIISLRPRWALYEVFTVRTLTIPLILFGAFWQLVENFNLFSGEQIEGLYTAAQRAFVGFALAVPLAIVVLIVISAGAVLLFFVNWWGFTLVVSGHRFVSRRGLLTTKVSAVDARRMRGITLSDTAITRLVRGVQLSPITTGLGGTGQSSGGAASNDTRMLPIVGRDEARSVGETLLDAEAGAGAEAVGRNLPTNSQMLRRGWLEEHPPVAFRRRLVRLWSWDAALLILCLPLVLAAGWSSTLYWIPAALAVVHVGVAFGDYRQLGHRMVESGSAHGRVICIREGFVFRRVHVLQLRGVCGVAVDQTWFQRRAGVATVTLSSAAGVTAYRVRDCSEAQVAQILCTVYGRETVQVVA